MKLVKAGKTFSVWMEDEDGNVLIEDNKKIGFTFHAGHLRITQDATRELSEKEDLIKNDKKLTPDEERQQLRGVQADFFATIFIKCQGIDGIESADDLRKILEDPDHYQLLNHLTLGFIDHSNAKKNILS